MSAAIDVRCPACGAEPGQLCTLASGLPGNAHEPRRAAARAVNRR